MQLDQHWRNALSGDSFSAGDSFQIRAGSADPVTRIDAARLLAANKTVLHIGCVDHLPLIDQKIADGTWMHEILCKTAVRCGGVDINAEGIEAMRLRGYGDLWVEDASAPNALAGTEWDLLFLGEMLEHVDNPVSFLAGLRETWQGRSKQVAITVPNSLCWSSVRAALSSGTEVINTDHRYGFTPYTIAKVATQAGFVVDELYMCDSSDAPAGLDRLRTAKLRLLTAALQRRPIFRPVIVASLSY